MKLFKLNAWCEILNKGFLIQIMGLLTDKNLATNQLEKLEPTKAARLTGQWNQWGSGEKILDPLPLRYLIPHIYLNPVLIATSMNA